MCLVVPAKVMIINKNIAKVDFGGIVKDVDVSFSGLLQIFCIVRVEMKNIHIENLRNF